MSPWASEMQASLPLVRVASVRDPIRHVKAVTPSLISAARFVTLGKLRSGRLTGPQVSGFVLRRAEGDLGSWLADVGGPGL